MAPEVGSCWRNLDTGETIQVDSINGPDVVVIGELDIPDRGEPYLPKPKSFLVDRTNFRWNYVPSIERYESCVCYHGGEDHEDHTPGIGCERRWCDCRFWPIIDEN